MTQTPPEFELVTTTRVACDGGGGALGHPRVYLTVDIDTHFVECGYCDKLFVDSHHAAEVLPKFGLDVPEELEG